MYLINLIRQYLKYFCVFNTFVNGISIIIISIEKSRFLKKFIFSQAGETNNFSVVFIRLFSLKVIIELYLGSFLTIYYISYSRYCLTALAITLRDFW